MRGQDAHHASQDDPTTPARVCEGAKRDPAGLILPALVPSKPLTLLKQLPIPASGAWQDQPGSQPATGAIFQHERAAMQLCDALRDCQSQPGAASLA